AAEGPAWSQDLCRTFTRPGGGQLAATAVANWPRGRRSDRLGAAPQRLAAAEAGGAGDSDQALAVHRGLEDLTLAPAGAAGRPDHARSLQKARTHCLHVVSIGTSRPGLNPTPSIRSVGWRAYVRWWSPSSSPGSPFSSPCSPPAGRSTRRSRS